MSRRLAHLLTCLYPRRWRERYGEEFEVLLQHATSRVDLRTAVNIVRSALYEHIFPIGGRKMDPHLTYGAMIRKPAAFLPLAMSLVALSLVLVHVALFGAVREADEGPTAHIWQILMAGQLPLVAWFAIRWLPRAPRQTAYVLAQHAGAALASVATVFFFNLG